MDRIDEFLKSLLDKTKEERDLLREKEHICPSEETAACYLDKLLKDTEKEDFEEHLAECGDCLQQIILLYDIKKEVEQSGYMEEPVELTQQAKNLVQEEIIQEEPVPAGSMAPESSGKSLANVIFEFFGKAIRARRGYRFVSYGSIALIVMLSVGVYSVIPTLPPEQPTLPSPNDYGIITRGGAPTQLTEQVIEEIDVNDLIKEPKTALPKEDIQPVEELVEKSPVEPSKDNVTLEGKWEGTKTVSIEPEEAFSEMITEEPEIAELTPPEAEETIGVLETKHKDASGKTIHKVKPNDSLFSISKKYFGDEAKWHKIYEVNRDNMSGPNALYIGQELVIPEITLAKRVTLPEDEVSLGLSMHIISHGKDTDGSVSEVTIEEGSILRSKDKFKVQFETKEDAYVYIIIHDSLNKANLLFPDPRITLSNNVKANSSHTVPTSEHWFWLDENVGIETVYVLASETPLDNIKALLLAMEDVEEPKQQIMEFVKDKASELRAISLRHIDK